MLLWELLSNCSASLFFIFEMVIYKWNKNTLYSTKRDFVLGIDLEANTVPNTLSSTALKDTFLPSKSLTFHLNKEQNENLQIRNFFIKMF